MAGPPTRPTPLSRVAALLALALLAAACDHYAAAGTAPTPELTPAAVAPPAGSSDPCARIGVGDPEAIAEPLIAGHGCLPPQEAVVYRCDPALDPVAMLDAAGVPRRFLGGAFAVPIPTLPPHAEPLGVVAAGRIYTIPSDPRSLFVQTGDRVERWLALAEPFAVSAPPSAWMVGDSILDGAAAAVEASLPGWEVTIDAEVGRGSYGAATAAEALAEPVPDVVVVEIGVNDHDGSAFSVNAGRIVAAVEGADLIVWVTPHGPDTDTDEVNAALMQVAAGLPNAAIADWDALVPEEALSSDGVHLLAGNEQIFADVLTPVLEGWRLAVTGQGATRCGDQIIAAISG